MTNQTKTERVKKHIRFGKPYSVPSSMSWTEAPRKTPKKFPEFWSRIGDSPFKMDTSLGDFNNSLMDLDEPFREYDFELEWKSPDEVLLEQFAMVDYFDGRHNQTFEFWLQGSSVETAQKYAEKMKSGSLFPAIVIEYDSDGNKMKFQEGRTRALAAKLAGLKLIPILKATHRR
mgnify:CR=1 FL=1